MRKSTLQLTLLVFITLWFLIMLILARAARADVVRPECQTEQSKQLRAEAWAYKTAAMAVLAQPVNSVASDLISKARLDTLRARGIESVKCPKIANAILNNMPATNTERAKINADFNKRQAIRRTFDAKMDQWSEDHPQCLHVEPVRRLVDGKPISGYTLRPMNEYTLPDDATHIYEHEDLSGRDNGFCRAAIVSWDKLGSVFSEYMGHGSKDKPVRADAFADDDCKAAFGDYWFGDDELPGGRVTKEDCSHS